MSKQNVTNTWTDGLNKDLNPIVTPNTVLTDNLNGTFITYNGNELSLQNDMGNVYKTSLSDGFYPIGMSEYGGIIYIASVNNGFVRYIKITDSISLCSFLLRIYSKSLAVQFSLYIVNPQSSGYGILKKCLNSLWTKHSSNILNIISLGKVITLLLFLLFLNISLYFSNSSFLKPK